MLMEKALYISEGVKPIERGQGIRLYYTNWYDGMVEVCHSVYVDDGVLCDSVAGLPQVWTTLEQAKRESGFHITIDLNNFVIACHGI